MKKILIAAMVVAWLGGGAVKLYAQDEAVAPPKVLLIDREAVKLGQSRAHEKSEEAFVRAAESVKLPTHYLAATTLSGPSEAFFLIGFDSYAQWGEDEKWGDQPKIEALLGGLMEKDSDFLTAADQVVATYNDKWSYQPNVDLSSMRFMEMETIVRRPGHDKEWEDLIALYQATAAKVNLDEHDVFYESHYGAQNGTVYIFTPRKSYADLDASMEAGKGFDAALGPDGMKKWSELIEATVESDSAQLLEFSPTMSYAPEAWVKADPTFWKPKPAAAVAPKAAAPVEKKN
ncbi:MAG TPA: hypothetical protein VMB02_06995 [Candidatus Aquilonibacter sp.]|nr:hypothetical protein [Candidatus Aquilonibacter sp.]